MSHGIPIRVDRTIELSWLDAVAASVAAEDGLKRTREKLFQLLDGRLSGSNKRGSSCHKTVGILSGVWADVPSDIEDFRNRAAVVLLSLEPRERIGLHWALLLAGFPFFYTLTGHTGRLIQLQGIVSPGQLNRRMREDLGDRTTVNRATSAITRSMENWGTLVDGSKRGSFAPLSNRISLGRDSTLILVEGLLRQVRRGLSKEEIESHPTLFPFDLFLRLEDMRHSGHFSVSRQGLDLNYVTLA